MQFLEPTTIAKLESGCRLGMVVVSLISPCFQWQVSDDEIATEKCKSICNVAFQNEFVKNWYDYWTVLLWSCFIGMVREQEKTYKQKSCIHIVLALGVPNYIALSFSAQT